MSPYRRTLPVSRTEPAGGRLASAVGIGLFLSLSLVRVVGALINHEVFGTEATLALFATLGAAWMLASMARGARRSSRSESGAADR